MKREEQVGITTLPIQCKGECSTGITDLPTADFAATATLLGDCKPFALIFIPSKEGNLKRLMSVSPLWCGKTNVHGFVLGRRSYQPRFCTAQTPAEPAVVVVVVDAIVDV